MWRRLQRELPLCAALSMGCAHTVDTPLYVAIEVAGLRQDERDHLKQQVCALDGVSACRIEDVQLQTRRSKRGEVTENAASPSQVRLVLEYRGTLDHLRRALAELPHPGLEPERAQVLLTYRGFDNQPPQLVVDTPVDGAVVNDKHLNVTARATDVDTATITIAGLEALSQSGGRYVGDVTLKSGDNEIVVKAVDAAGNATEVVLEVVLDDVPPPLEVEVEVLAYDKARVKGRVKDATLVEVDGKPVTTDLFGAFAKEVAVFPDKPTIEVIATDAAGNTSRIKRSSKKASALSGESTR